MIMVNMMKQNTGGHNSIPISLALEENLNSADQAPRWSSDKKRLFFISVLAVGIGMAISGISKLLIFLINLITNLSFHQQFSFLPSSPATNSLGLMVILLPVIGGLII